MQALQAFMIKNTVLMKILNAFKKSPYSLSKLMFDEYVSETKNNI